MRRISRPAMRAGLAVGAMTVLLGLRPSAAIATDVYVKYYTVTSSHRGAPENLTEIARRFLGDGARSAELFNLNSGVRQFDGGRLTDPRRLRAGWILELPWDAVGGSVQYGVRPSRPGRAIAPPAPGQDSLPGAPLAAPGTSAPSATGPAPAAARQTGAAAPAGTANPALGANPANPALPGANPALPGANPANPASPGANPAASAAVRPTTPPAGRPRPGCGLPAATAGRSGWAALRLAPEQAWPQSRGKGQLVAVVDSGVDGAVPQLAGHLTQGLDTIGGSGRGDSDCLGTGTAMAGLIVAQSGTGGDVAGIAPDATVLPVRMVADDGRSRPGAAADAITGAADAGAGIIALGSRVALADPDVVRAIAGAVAKDVVVVVCAPVPPAGPAVLGDGVLRVGGIAVDGRPADRYRTGDVDVVAPGVAVTALGVTGAAPATVSGTQYAVAYTAGVAALVRTAHPGLSAAQVAHRVIATAGRAGRALGAGLISPAAAVTAVLPEEAGKDAGRTPAAPAPDERRTGPMIMSGLVALGAAALLALRLRGLLRRRPDEDETDHDDGPPPGGLAAPVVTRPHWEVVEALPVPAAPGTQDRATGRIRNEGQATRG